MSKNSRTDLLGYLLGALDEPQQQQVERQLVRKSQLRDQLDGLRCHLAPLESLRPVEAPVGWLAERTCQLLPPRPALPAGRPESLARSTFAAAADDSLSLRPARSSVRGTDCRPSMLRGEPSFTIREMVTAAAVLLVVGSVTVMALHQNRVESRIAQCQNNLRQIGQGLLAYSSANGGSLVPIPREGNLSVAGFFAPFLLESQLVDDASVFFCSGNGNRSDRGAIPTMDEVLAAAEWRLRELQQRLAGDYGYTLGYVDQGRYHAVTNLQRHWYVIVADAPSADRPGRQSDHHRGRGQNCLFEDGRVVFVTSSTVPGTADAIYENHWGMVAPGMGPHDVVIAGSHVSPFATLPGAQTQAD